MISRYEAFMNGVALSTICEDLAILDIEYESPAKNAKTAVLAKRNGSVITQERYENGTVTITFELHLYSTAERMLACQKVAEWAMIGGILKTSDRPGQRLRCICEQPPIITSAKRWTDPLSVVFSAYVIPFWEEDIPAKKTISTADSGAVLYVPGNVGEALADVTVSPVAAVTSVTVTAGDKHITLSDINIPAEQAIKLYYDDNAILHIESNGTSLLNKRTADSSDDISFPCGKRTAIGITASATATATFSARGLWV